MKSNAEKKNLVVWDFYYSPRCPDSVWQRVLMKLHHSACPHPQTPENDQFIQEVIRVESFRLRSLDDRSRKKKSKQKPGHSTINFNILEAMELGLAESVTADLIRAYVLANQPPQEIAELVGRRIEVITTFERLFFDVRRRLDAWGWILAYVIVPAFQTLDELDPMSDAFAVARDRAVLLRTAYSLGIPMLNRIVQPARFHAEGSTQSPMNHSPVARILTWLWTSDPSVEFDLKLFERIDPLFENSHLNEAELNERFDVLAKMIDQYEAKRKAAKNRPHRQTDTPHTKTTASNENVVTGKSARIS